MKAIIVFSITSAITLAAIVALAIPAGQTATINFSVLYDFAANPDLAGFVVYSGTTSSNYTTRTSMGLSTNFAIGGFPRNTQVYLNMTAISTNGVESDFTGEQTIRTWNKPKPLAGFQATQQ